MALRGEQHKSAKLSDDDCAMIRVLSMHYGLSYRVLAEKYEVSKSQIANIVTGQQRIDSWDGIYRP